VLYREAIIIIIIIIIIYEIIIIPKTPSLILMYEEHVPTTYPYNTVFSSLSYYMHACYCSDTWWFRVIIMHVCTSICSV